MERIGEDDRAASDIDSGAAPVSATGSQPFLPPARPATQRPAGLIFRRETSIWRF